jgi:hypothetical protein
MAEVLTELARRQISIGVCTNKAEAPARLILERTGLAAHVSALVGVGIPPRFLADHTVDDPTLPAVSFSESFVRAAAVDRAMQRLRHPCLGSGGPGSAGSCAMDR